MLADKNISNYEGSLLKLAQSEMTDRYIEWSVYRLQSRLYMSNNSDYKQQKMIHNSVTKVNNRLFRLV